MQVRVFLHVLEVINKFLNKFENLKTVDNGSYCRKIESRVNILFKISVFQPKLIRYVNIR